MWNLKKKHKTKKKKKKSGTNYIMFKWDELNLKTDKKKNFLDKNFKTRFLKIHS